jgi:hypothetical protein
MRGEELRTRIKTLGLTYAQAAPRLGLTIGGLTKQMRSVAGVSRQTELLLECMEKHQSRARVLRIVERSL